MLGKERSLNWSRSRSNERQLDLRKYGTTVTDAENQFLENMPDEIKEVLRWHADAQSTGQVSQSIVDFAGRFLGGMYEDGAVLPTNLSASAPEVLALVLVQHRTSPRTVSYTHLGNHPRGEVLRRGAISP